ncbi:winged helix-turn-helix domain-containing protein [Methylobacterium sp. E-065]|uniref:winged helix-turn-helix domain-containing protein n=1 Tax=Methylobacterium sp. E-065 TaxID=2836583 RepID=UPI001FB87666|nr:helix-turn-helix domain-containing protein [Methylobacterium sp. E-065]MCJ2020563.1 winged helix-turn-helix domain-containing protein [Methylobacterium sp. E-065]
MTAALRIRIEELEEEIRQLKAAFSPKVGFPASWRLDAPESAILSALFHTKGSYVTPEALLLLLVRPDDDADESTTRAWLGRLRRKVEPRGIAITTRHTQGYQLEAAGRAIVADALGLAQPQTAAATEPPLKHPRGWCDGQDAVVRAGYARHATLCVIRIELIAAGFKERSFGSISTRAQTLGLASVRAAPLWSEPEDEILREAYEAGAFINEIRLQLAQAGFRRNRGAIQMRAIALGVAGGRTRVWTQAEKAIVRSGLNAERAFEAIRVELAEKGFERGLTSIVRLAHKMGVNRATTPWSDAELATLRRLYAERRSVREIADTLGRNVPGVASMASKLGLKQRQRWTDEDRAVLLRAFEAGDTLDVVCRELDRPLPAVSTEARRMCLQFPPTPRRPQIRDLAA